jgi:SAM-dependent methyltransferase
MSYEDHFSAHAGAYSRHRPRYPDELFDWLSTLISGRGRAWDAGTGNGQVAASLTNFMDHVVATDASAEQLAHAVQHDRVEYRHEPSGRSSLEDASVDLITAGAAAHWFDLEEFYREVKRVARPDAVIALFSYGPRDIAAAIDPVLTYFQEEVLNGFWPERIDYVHASYATLPFPFEEIAAPELKMTAEWNLAELLAFLETWSASQRYFDQNGSRSTQRIETALLAAWGDPSTRRISTFPLFIRVGRM